MKSILLLTVIGILTFSSSLAQIQNKDAKDYYVLKYNKKHDLKSLDLIRLLKNNYALVYESSNNLESFESYHKYNHHDYLLRFKNTQSPTLLIKLNTNNSKLKAYNNFINTPGNIFCINSSSINEIDQTIGSSINYIGIENLIPVHESSIREMNLSINGVSTVHSKFSNINGEMCVIALKDEMFDTLDIDIYGKHVSNLFEADEINTHSTNMATIISGSGNSSWLGKGVSYSSKLLCTDYNNLFPDTVELFNEYNITVQNHSYGTSIENFYGLLAESYDAFCVKNPNILHVFSAGNSGDSIPQNGIYSGVGHVANLTGNFKMSKNTISVGAIASNNELMHFSSHGPAFDGRIKPEVVAYSMQGTSNSAAIVSGIANLFQQTYRNTFESNMPSSLIKAILINSAKYVHLPTPNHFTGFGSVNAYSGIKTIINGYFIIDSVFHEQRKSYPLLIPDSISSLKITLYWTDVEAPAGSEVALMNDLDLKLISPEGEEILPWKLSTFPHIDSISKAAVRGIDRINNVEQISLKKPLPGTYMIQTTGFDLYTEKQNFSLVYDLQKMNQFEWLYPVKGSALSNQDHNVFLQWESTFDEPTGKLFLSDNQDWVLLSDTVNLEQRNFYLSIQSIEFNGPRILKMKIGDSEFISDTFIIANEQYLQIGLNCDSVMELNWRKDTYAQKYQVQKLNNNAFETIAEITDTTFVFQAGNQANSHFAIQAIYNNNILGLRNASLDISESAEKCYIESFYGINSESGNEIELFVQLGSLYNVRGFELARYSKGSFTEIHSNTNLNSKHYKIIDKNPEAGINSYRLNVFTNDNHFHSETSISFINNNEIALFPNPANGGVNILSSGNFNDKLLFELYNIDARKIFESSFFGEQDYVNFDDLRSGIYYFKISYQSKVLKTGKLIISNVRQ